MTLLSVAAAQRRITRNLKAVPTETVPLESCGGRILAANIKSTDLPQFDNSSVDGFAVIAADLEGASHAAPRKLRVVADIPAGSSRGVRLESGQAARVMTGAIVPASASAVIMLEDTDAEPRPGDSRAPRWIKALSPLQRGANIRRRGSDARRGRTILGSGQRLRAQDIGFLAMLGISRVRVFRRPRVALLSSGNEIVPAGRRLQSGQIRDTNTPTLRIMIETLGGEALSLGVARDTHRSIEALLERALHKRADLIVSSAGVSVGAFDLVRGVIEARGHLDFWRVNVRPGKPLAVGRYRRTPFIGLPGNPVSAFVGFELFVRPALAKLAGLRHHARRVARVVLAEPVQTDGRESYLRAVVEERQGTFHARLTGHQGSGNLLSLVQANALLIVPAGVKSLSVGDQANAWLL
jgi:molybdopterin molybdotransferase